MMMNTNRSNRMDLTHVETEIQKFSITDSAIAELKNKYGNLTITGIDDKNGYSEVREARILIKNKRVEVEKKRKELTADALSVQRAINEEAKRITGLLEPLEVYLELQESEYNKEKERVKLEIENEKKLKYQSRIDRLSELNVKFNAVNFIDEYTQGFHIKISPVELQSMTDTVFSSLLLTARTTFENQNKEILRLKEEKEKVEAERKAQAEREESLRQERLAKEAEERRIENERLEKIRAEQEIEGIRLKKIQEEQEAKQLALKEEEERIKKEQNKIEKPIFLESRIHHEDQAAEPVLNEFSIELSGRFKYLNILLAEDKEKAEKKALDYLNSIKFFSFELY